MTDEEKSKIKEYIENKDLYIDICKKDDYYFGIKVSNEYETISKRYEEYYRSVLDAGLAAAGAMLAYKTHKVDPYIAGGAGQAIGGVGAGVYSALSANERNKQIDAARSKSLTESYSAQGSKNYAEKKLLESYYRLKELLDSSKGIKEYYLEKDYKTGQSLLDSKSYELALVCFNKTRNYKDTEAIIEKIHELQNIEKEKAAEKRKKILKIVALIAMGCVVIAVIVTVLIAVILPSIKKSNAYNDALATYENGDYDAAIKAFEELGDYKDSKEQIEIIQKAKAEDLYKKAEELFDEGKYSEALKIYKDVPDYSDSSEKIGACIRIITEEIISGGATDISALSSVPDDYYKSHKESSYLYGQALIDIPSWSDAKKYFKMCDKYESAKEYVTYCEANIAINNKDVDDAIELLGTINGFLDSDKLISELYYEKVISADKMSIENAAELLNLAPDLNGEEQKLRDLCNECAQCAGEYRCIDHLGYNFKLSFKLKNGNVSATVSDSFLVDPERMGYLKDLIIYQANPNYSTFYKYSIVPEGKHGYFCFYSGQAIYIWEKSNDEYHFELKK